jgi:hypothetical protein
MPVQPSAFPAATLARDGRGILLLSTPLSVLVDLVSVEQAG